MADDGFIVAQRVIYAAGVTMGTYYLFGRKSRMSHLPLHLPLHFGFRFLKQRPNSAYTFDAIKRDYVVKVECGLLGGTEVHHDILTRTNRHHFSSAATLYAQGAPKM